MVATRKKRQQNRMLLSQFSDSGADFMSGQTNSENMPNAADNDISLKNANIINQVNGPCGCMYTLEINIVDQIRSEVDSVKVAFETTVKVAELTAVENLVNSRVELAMKSVNASTECGVGSVVLDPDQMDFSGSLEDPQMTASIRMNSQTD